MTDARVFSGSTAPAEPSRGLKLLVRVVIYIAGSYLLLCILLFLIQNRLVFQPSTTENLNPANAGFGPRQTEAVETKTSDGLTLKGWHVSGGKPRAGGSPRKLEDAALVVLFFTGNAGHRGDRMGNFRQLNALGAHVVCFDYRGYGDNPGSPSEEGVALDARAAWDYLRAQKVPAERIVIHGESLGGAVAIRLAAELCSEGTVPGGLITEATFTRLKDVAARQYWFVPVGLLLRSNFPSVERIPKVTCPLLAIHGRQDELIPFDMGQKLFAAAPETSANGRAKTFVEIPNAFHNDVPFAHPQKYLAIVEEFFAAVAPEIERKRREPPKARSPEEMKQKAPKSDKKTEFQKGRNPVLAPENNAAKDSRKPPAGK